MLIGFHGLIFLYLLILMRAAIDTDSKRIVATY